ncbi:hypothetical protein LCGC14_1589250, partial [marine sediment metagenome]
QQTLITPPRAQNPAGLSGGSFGFPLQEGHSRDNPPGNPAGFYVASQAPNVARGRTIRRASRRDFPLQARLQCSEKPKNPPDKPAGFV